MTESRGAMTAQQLRELITRHLTLNSFIDSDYLTGYLRFDDVLRELNALSAHNTAQLTEELEAKEKELSALREWKKSILSALKSVPEWAPGKWAGDKEGWGFNFEFINWMRRELGRLRSQGAGPWPQDAARAYHDEICPRHANSCADCINRLSEIIRKHAPVEGVGLWLSVVDELPIPHKENPSRSDEQVLKFADGRVLVGFLWYSEIADDKVTHWQPLQPPAGLASPPEGQP